MNRELIAVRLSTLKGCVCGGVRQFVSSVRVQIGAVAGTYGLLVTAFLLARLVVGEQWRVIAILNNVAHWVTLGSAVSLLATLLAPNRRFWTVYCLPGVIAFGVWYGVLFVPNPFTTSHAVGLRLTVATYNLRNSLYHTDQKQTVIAEMNPAILGIQEAGRGAGLEQLRTMYPYSACGTDVVGDLLIDKDRRVAIANLVILSRYPIEADETRLITYPIDGDATRLMPVALRAQVNVDGQLVAVYVMHAFRPRISIRPLVYDGSERTAGVHAIIEAIQQEEPPVLVLCDCNMSPQTDDYARLDRLLVDAWQVKGSGLGLTAPDDQHDIPFLLMRSDYIWYSGALDVLKIEVWPTSGGSDHRPVWAQFSFNTPKR